MHPEAPGSKHRATAHRPVAPCSYSFWSQEQWSMSLFSLAWNQLTTEVWKCTYAWTKWDSYIGRNMKVYISCKSFFPNIKSLVDRGGISSNMFQSTLIRILMLAYLQSVIILERVEIKERDGMPESDVEWCDRLPLSGCNFARRGRCTPEIDSCKALPSMASAPKLRCVSSSWKRRATQSRTDACPGRQGI